MKKVIFFAAVLFFNSMHSNATELELLEPLKVNCGDSKDPMDWMEQNPGKFAVNQEILCDNEDQLFQEAGQLINEIQHKRSEKNEGIKRGFHAKGHMCAKASLLVYQPKVLTGELSESEALEFRDFDHQHPWEQEYLKSEMQQDIQSAFSGPVFGKPGRLDAYVRLSNGDPSVQNDKLPDFRGFAIKVLPEADGYDQMEESIDKESQDFLMLSNPRMVAGSGKRFLDFVKATSKGSLSLATGTYALLEIVKNTTVGSFLRKFFISSNPAHYPRFSRRRFWSGSAIRWGNRAARYLVFPCKPSSHHDPHDQTIRRNVRKMKRANSDYKGNYYRTQLEYDNKNDAWTPPVCYDVFVQFQKNESHSIENAAAIWEEGPSSLINSDVSTPILVGQITANIDNPAEESECASKSFNPWNGSEFHRPLGSINRIRKQVYQKSVELRKDVKQLR